MSHGKLWVFESSLRGSLSRRWDSWRLSHPVSPVEPPSTVVSAGFLEGVIRKRQSCRSKWCNNTHVPVGVSDGLKEGQEDSDGREAARDSGKNAWCRHRDELIHRLKVAQCKGFLTEFDSEYEQNSTNIFRIFPSLTTIVLASCGIPSATREKADSWNRHRYSLILLPISLPSNIGPICSHFGILTVNVLFPLSINTLTLYTYICFMALYCTSFCNYLFINHCSLNSRRHCLSFSSETLGITFLSPPGNC